MQNRYFTTPIYYVNGDPHIGHAYTSVVGDALRRVVRMQGAEAMLTTGTDEHGQKNQEAAAAAGMEAGAYLARQSAQFRALFDRLDVGYDHYVRTTAPTHARAVEIALQRLWDRELIVKKLYRGLYCVGCEQFKLERDLDEQGRCPDHLVAPVESEETNYFLRLEPFREWLVGRLRADDQWIQPEHFRREVLGMLDEPLEDLSISRPKERVTLGVELPFDRDYVAYVWFDALLNYVSSLGWPDDEQFARWWPAAMHLLGKDILKTHCIYWPIMLRALELDPPAGYRVHGYLVGEGGRKMSKSLGNAVDPTALIDAIGSDGLRYYLLRILSSGDSQISDRLVVQTYNAELANTLGNLFSRVLRFAAKQGQVPAPDRLAAEDAAVLDEVCSEAQRVLDGTEFLTLAQLPKAINELAGRLNAHVEQVAPWTLKDESEKPRLDSVIYATMEALRIVAELSWPVMPGISARALEMLGAPPLADRVEAHTFRPFRLRKGAPIAKPPALFPRVASD